MIEARDLTVTYDGRDVLHKVTLTVPDGAHIALMGPSGCGKTTLLRVLAGLRAPDGGSVRVSPGRIACVFQEPRLLPWRTAAENVNAVLSDRAQTMPQARAWLERLELGAAAEQYPAALSGGMQQRVAIARALAYDAPVLLLDEPFSALDYQTRLAVSGDIAQIIRREHKTALLVTHDISEAISLSDRIVVLTHRPATVKAIHDLGALRTVPPLQRRSRAEFQTLFNQIWEELDVNA